MWELLCPLCGDERDKILREIAAWAGASSAPQPELFPVTTGDLRALSESSLFEIGAHSATHARLGQLSLREQEQEIAESKRALEEMTGRPVTSFAYPYGNFTRETVRLVQRLGFDHACTSREKPVRPTSKMCQLPRFSVPNWTGLEFKRQVETWLRDDEAKRARKWWAKWLA